MQIAETRLGKIGHQNIVDGEFCSIWLPEVNCSFDDEQSATIDDFVPVSSLISTTPLLCPVWVCLQLGEEGTPKSFSSLLRTRVPSEGISFHPSLRCYTPRSVGCTIANALAELDDNAISDTTIYPLNELTRRHKDLFRKIDGSLSLFKFLWTYGVTENRLKHLGTSAPKWATRQQILVANAIAILRTELKKRFYLSGEALPFPALNQCVFISDELPSGRSFQAILGRSALSDLQDGTIEDVSEIFQHAGACNKTVVMKSGKSTTSRAVSGGQPICAESKSHQRSYSGIEESVVYSVNIGSYDEFPVPPQLEAARYFLITDANPKTVPEPWQVVAPMVIERDVKRQCLWYKTHPHWLFPNALFTVWMDSNVECLSGSENLLNAHKSLSEVATFKHPDRSCIFEELDVIKRDGLDYESVVCKVEERLRSGSMPKSYGLFETNVLFLRARDPAVRRFLDLWWWNISLGSRRDQASFTYASWKTRLHVNLLDGDRCCKDSRYFCKRPHNTSSSRVLFSKR